MHLTITSTAIDIIILLFFIFMMIKGIKDGFIVRFYDIVSTIAVIIITFIYYKPIASLIQVYSYKDDLISTVIGPFINTVVIFLLLLVILFIIKIVLGLMLKPVLTWIVERLHISKMLNVLLGTLLSFMEAFLIVYIVLSMIVLPFFSNSQEVINDTAFAKRIVNIVPEYSTELSELMNGVSLLQSTKAESKEVLETMLNTLIDSYEADIITLDKASELIETQLKDDILKYHPALISSRKVLYTKIVNHTHLSLKEKTQLITSLGES